MALLRRFPRRGALRRSFVTRENHWFNFSTKCAVSQKHLPLACDMESESLGRYRPGGYHPVNIGDSFSSGRYRVVHKLGWGGYSTVWLAYDSSLSRLVALKIVVSELREVSNEIRILRHISSISTAHEGYRHLRKIVDHFLHDGPNGRHQCLVFNVDGISAPALLGHYGGGERLPGSVAWDISRQLLLAVDCLHSNGIGHAGKYISKLCSLRECSKEDQISILAMFWFRPASVSSRTQLPW